MRCFSLFSGIGGFDLAMRNLGHETVGACEIDRYARSVYAKNFPGVPIWEDATKINPKELPDFEILCAGFPCQSFSIAGKRRGFDDTRGSLFFEIARVAKEKQPPILLLENVKGLLSHDKGKTFHTIINTLDEVGYDVSWQIINSKYFVPQNRERIFIIGHLRGERIRKVFPLGDYDKQTDRKIKRIGGYSQCSAIYDSDGLFPTLSACTHGYAIGNIAVVNDHGTLKEREISNNLDANYWKGMDNHAQRTMIVADRSRSYAGKGRKLESPKDISNSLTSVTKDNYVATFVYFSNTNANMKQRTQDRKETWTLGTGTDFGLNDGTRIRRLTPKECERLQGFPDDYTRYGENNEEISDTQRYKMCGNAVTVPVIQYVLENIL